MQYENQNELYHYGVPGMKWGQRKAQKYADKASISRAAAKQWETKAKNTKSGFKRASYEESARLERAKADMFTRKSKGTYSKRADKYAAKARLAKESAKEWEQLSKTAKERGKTLRSEKFRINAKDDRLAAKYYEQKSKKIIENKLKRRQFVKDVSKTSVSAGKKTVDKVKSKLLSRK